MVWLCHWRTWRHHRPYLYPPALFHSRSDETPFVCKQYLHCQILHTCCVFFFFWRNKYSCSISSASHGTRKRETNNASQTSSISCRERTKKVRRFARKVRRFFFFVGDFLQNIGQNFLRLGICEWRRRLGTSQSLFQGLHGTEVQQYNQRKGRTATTTLWGLYGLSLLAQTPSRNKCRQHRLELTGFASQGYSSSNELHLYRMFPW